MLVDYHMHTDFSDGHGLHQDYISKAIAEKIDIIGFSEHICFKETNWAVQPLRIEEWTSFMSNLRQEQKGFVKFGVEMDYLPGKESLIRDFVQQYDFDYVLGSVHFIENWNFDTNNIEHFENYDIYQIWEAYFKLLQKAATSKLFDIMAHADLIKKFNYRPEQSILKFYRETAEVFREAGVVYELNTSGLNKPCNEFYPSRQFIEELFAAEVPVTLGSDAHRPSSVGQHFEQAVQLLKSVGYRQIATFERRERVMRDLG